MQILRSCQYFSKEQRSLLRNMLFIVRYYNLKDLSTQVGFIQVIYGHHALSTENAVKITELQ